MHITFAAIIFALALRVPGEPEAVSKPGSRRVIYIDDAYSILVDYPAGDIYKLTPKDTEVVKQRIFKHSRPIVFFGAAGSEVAFMQDSSRKLYEVSFKKESQKVRWQLESRVQNAVISEKFVGFNSDDGHVLIIDRENNRTIEFGIGDQPMRKVVSIRNEKAPLLVLANEKGDLFRYDIASGDFLKPIPASQRRTVLFVDRFVWSLSKNILSTLDDKGNLRELVKADRIEGYSLNIDGTALLLWTTKELHAIDTVRGEPLCKLDIEVVSAAINNNKNAMVFLTKTGDTRFYSLDRKVFSPAREK